MTRNIGSVTNDVPSCPHGAHASLHSQQSRSVRVEICNDCTQGLFGQLTAASTHGDLFDLVNLLEVLDTVSPWQLIRCVGGILLCMQGTDLSNTQIKRADRQFHTLSGRQPGSPSDSQYGTLSALQALLSIFRQKADRAARIAR